ncbi:Protein of unknown function [Bacillus cereus]|nr:Protein of unknown function [Bacillus cereus]SCN04022.1 Protein of unknown function [Bacillus wiedmannii]SCN34505.1 Protein of unknown function [Bacillus wiedmannii]
MECLIKGVCEINQLISKTKEKNNEQI